MFFLNPGLCFKFNYFALRKNQFCHAINKSFIFAAGFTTIDKLFALLTMFKTGIKTEIPIILFGKKYWDKVINLKYLADIADEKLYLF